VFHINIYERFIYKYALKILMKNETRRTEHNHFSLFDSNNNDNMRMNWKMKTINYFNRILEEGTEEYINFQNGDL